MKPLRKLVTSLIGFDRREKRGTYVLSALLVTLIILRLLAFRPGEVPAHLPPLPGEASEQSHLLPGETPDQAAGKATPVQPFNFDPNTVSPDDLLKLGLSERQARTLVNYRSSGARFRKPQDLLRVYGIDSALAAGLLPYIVIGDAGGVPKTRESDRNTRTASNGDPDISPQPMAGAETGMSSHKYEHGASVANTASGRGPAGTARGEYPPAVTVGDPAGLLLDLNRCTAEELVGLPGIGPVLSVRIVRFRSLLGGFVDTGQLAEIYGLDSTVVRLVDGRLTLTYDSVRPIELDSASFGELARHPYLGYEAARQITRYRSVAASPVTLGEMVVRGVITPQQAVRIAPYVRPAKGTSGSDYEFILSKVLK